MNPLVIVLLIVLFLVIIATVVYFIWLRRHVPVPPTPSPPVTPPTPPTPPYSGPAYANPTWGIAQSSSYPNGLVAGTKYDNASTSAPACSASIQSAAQAANDASVVGWTWISSPTQPNTCRAITNTNMSNQCVTPASPPWQAYISNSALSYYNMTPCSPSPQH